MNTDSKCQFVRKKSGRRCPREAVDRIYCASHRASVKRDIKDGILTRIPPGVLEKKRQPIIEEVITNDISNSSIISDLRELGRRQAAIKNQIEALHVNISNTNKNLIFQYQDQPQSKLRWSPKRRSMVSNELYTESLLRSETDDFMWPLGAFS